MEKEFGDQGFDGGLSGGHAPNDDEVLLGQVSLNEAIGEVPHVGGGVARPHDEAEHLVALLVEVLDALAIEAVVLNSGELPRGILDASVDETVEVVRYLHGDIFYWNVCGRLALGITCLPGHGGLSCSIGNFSIVKNFVTLVIKGTLSIIDLVELAAPLLGRPCAGRGKTVIGIRIVDALSDEVIGDNWLGVVLGQGQGGYGGEDKCLKHILILNPYIIIILTSP